MTRQGAMKARTLKLTGPRGREAIRRRQKGEPRSRLADSVRVLIPESLCPQIRAKAHRLDKSFSVTCVELIRLGLKVDPQEAATRERDPRWPLRPGAERVLLE